MPFRQLALLLILGSAVLRILYLAHDCPLDLSPDEAHYWDWSRHLDWSYYSKGPLVAWLIRASCELFGDWSIALTGYEMVAVRLPAVLCGSLTLLGLYLLTLRVYRSDKLALGVVLIALTLPVFAAGSILMTIDAPYVCCWTWALVLAHRLLFLSRPEASLRASRVPEPDGPLRFEDSPRGVGASLRASGGLWALLGLVIGLGILAKYTMVLFIPSLGLFLLFSPTHRHALVRPAFWSMTVVAALCSLPILIWNAEHDWVTFRHVGKQAGVQGDRALNWLGPLEYLGGQFALLLGFWFVAYKVSVVRGPWSGLAEVSQRTSDDGQRTFLWCMSVPMFVLFLGLSLKTKVQLNWPVAAYLSGLVLAAAWLTRQWQSPVAWWRRLSRGTILFASFLGLAVTVLMHHTEWVYPWLSPHTNPRRFDPTCRLRGWRTLAGEVDRLRSELRAKGVEPVLAASGWALPGEIAFYLPDHPTVYSFGLAMGGRHSQYDLWRPNPAWDPEEFRGRTMIYVGEMTPAIVAAFQHVEPSRLVAHDVGGLRVAAWTVTVCHGFRGFAHGHDGGY